VVQFTGRTVPGHCEIKAKPAGSPLLNDASYITGETIYPDGGRRVLNYTVPVTE